jgi:hydrogenase nickel incorporation protein HypB
MCATCGCSPDAATVHELHQHDHTLADHYHGHSHHHEAKKVVVEKDVLHHNNLLAQRNRGYFQARHMLALNLVSSPGSGKTTLLEKTLRDLKEEVPCCVIEGDQQTTNDADRIHATGTPVVQINTGKGCHLDAHMVFHAIEHLRPKKESILFIENVGNLVCPAMFDLGETARVVIASVTEGDDKPLKYPDMFHTSQVCIINKMDLLPYVPFSVEAFKRNALKVAPQLLFFEVSALKEEGLVPWKQWLKQHIPAPEIA